MTRSDLRESLIMILTEANAPGGTLEDFDLDGIIDACHEVTGSYNLHAVGNVRFWEIVRQHDRTQQEG